MRSILAISALGPASPSSWKWDTSCRCSRFHGRMSTLMLGYPVSNIYEISHKSTRPYGCFMYWSESWAKNGQIQSQPKVCPGQLLIMHCVHSFFNFNHMLKMDHNWKLKASYNKYPDMCHPTQLLKSSHTGFTCLSIHLFLLNHFKVN